MKIPLSSNFQLQNHINQRNENTVLYDNYNFYIFLSLLERLETKQKEEEAGEEKERDEETDDGEYAIHYKDYEINLQQC